MAACSFQSESSWTRPCCITTRTKCLAGLKVSLVRSAVIVPNRKPISVPTLPPPPAMVSTSSGCEDDAGVHRRRNVLFQASEQIRLSLRLVQIVEGAHLGAAPDFVRGVEGQLAVSRRAIPHAIEVRLHPQPLAVAKQNLIHLADRSRRYSVSDRLVDEVWLALIAARRSRAGDDGAESHAAPLPARNLDHAHEQAVLPEFERVDLELPKNRAPDDSQHHLGDGPLGRADCDAVLAGGVEDGVTDHDLEWVVPRQPGIDLDRADDAVLDVDPGARAIEFEAGIGGPQRLAVVLEPPARHERAMSNGQFSQISFNVDSPAGHKHAVEDETAARRSGDHQAVRNLGMPVDELNNRASSVCGSQLERLTLT